MPVDAQTQQILETHDGVCRSLADRTGFVVVAVERGAQVRFQLLVYPVTDLTRDTPSFHENADGYMLAADAAFDDAVKALRGALA